MSIRHGGVVMRIPENAVLQGPPQVAVQTGPEPRRTDNFKPATITASTNGSIQGPPQIPVQTGSEPRRTDNFRPATITTSTNGSIQGPPSFLPVFFGAGLAMLIILNSGRGSLFTLNFR